MWQTILREQGYLQFTFQPHSNPLTRWNALSYLSNYAHLLQAGAMYIMLHTGQTDWELMRLPPLPDGAP